MCVEDGVISVSYLVLGEINAGGTIPNGWIGWGTLDSC